jgi:hypothetical protein
LTSQRFKRAESIVIDARRHFAFRGRELSRPMERIVFDPARQTCRTMQMSLAELEAVIALVKQECDALLDERRAAQG